MKRIDCHCHIYPEAIAARAVAGTGKFYDLPLVYGGTLSDLISVHDGVKISGGVIFSVATTPRQAESINRFIAETAAESGGRFIGLGTVHPDSETIEEDIENIIALGLRGVKLHPDIQKFRVDAPKCLKIYELCEGRLPVLLHAGDHRYDFSNPRRLSSVLSVFPSLTVIGAHFGGWSVWEEAVALLTSYKNFYVDTSSSLYALSPERATEIIRAYGKERVLFATDYPMWRMDEELARFDSLALTEEEKACILYKNAERLFGCRIGD
ncbi:MAG: amidohydrolase [Ruminococcaceae bacterium]|nr:amidohydrolase [Oscillospiraceae bacterium]